MKPRCAIAALLVAAAVLLLPSAAPAQVTPPPRVRRAIPLQEPPVARALPVETPMPADAPTEPAIRRALPVPEETEVAAPPPQPNTPPAGAPSAEDTESPEQRQLNYANALFGRKLYDLAVPEYEKFLGLYPNSPDRVTALFYMGEAYRLLQRRAAARTSFQTLVADFPDDELAGPAAYGLAEIAFKEKDYATALPLFHRAAAKAKSSALALSARYFEGRCLENLGRKDEARDVYQQVIAVGNPNPFRDDSRLAIGLIFLDAGRKSESLKQF
ncbi:MAG TPA: tetratricopeptide repeat protein, partial [Chthoniobacterales bacterium]|nr:tetratricopeptide repeat protein [Chthoniobacterales bacterium]